MNRSILFFILLFAQQLSAQPNLSKTNFDLEVVDKDQNLPHGFINWGESRTSVSTVSQSGKHAVLIENPTVDGQFGCAVTEISGGFKGKSITLKGYIKTENITEGYAGLIIRINSEDRMLAIKDHSKKGLTGTQDWTLMELSMKYPEPGEVAFIYVGGILEGKGKAWFDNFSLTIDGKPIQKLKRVEVPQFDADKDTEFDKGSGIQWSSVDGARVQDLYLLGKVWGFLKYHHPTIAKGKLNWDYELFRMLGKMESTPLEEILTEILDQLGPPNSPSKRKLPKGKIKLKPENDWIRDEKLLSPLLSKRLLAVEVGKKEKKHYYIGFHPFVSNPRFKNEQSYPQMDWDDTGMRLLSFFRYWNMVQYYFPNRHLMDENWDDVLKEFIPKMVTAEDELQCKLYIIQFIGKIQDTHANVWGKEATTRTYFGNQIVPVFVRFVEKQPVVIALADSLPSDYPLQVGDVILKIDGVPAQECIQRIKPYCTASNEPTLMRNVGRKLLRTNADEVSIKVARSNGDFEFSVPTWTIGEKRARQPSPGSHRIIEGDIGYIYPEALERGQGQDVMETFMDKKGVIFDMRCYPGDFLPYTVVGKLLLPHRATFVQFTKGSKSHPGAFTFSGEAKIGKSKNKDAYTGKIVVLIDDRTQSSAEYQTMALQQVPGAVVIGSQTSGADGNVSSIYLPGNVFTYISGIGILTPEGDETQRIGIVPDIELKPTLAGIQAGRDELLEKAIEIVRAAE